MATSGRVGDNGVMADNGVAGLVLAAGAGRRFGGPKALARDSPSDPTWVERAVCRLAAADLSTVLVVVGAEADRVSEVLLSGAWAHGRETTHRVEVHLIEAADWADGMGASLRAGLSAAAEIVPDASGLLVTLVDLPDVDERVHRRVLTTGEREGPAALVRAAYDGRPGHPVLIGRDHWTGVAAVAHGDRGARDYFAAHPPHLVECGDLATGRDVDRPESQA